MTTAPRYLQKPCFGHHREQVKNRKNRFLSIFRANIKNSKTSSCRTSWKLFGTVVVTSYLKYLWNNFKNTIACIFHLKITKKSRFFEKIATKIVQKLVKNVNDAFFVPVELIGIQNWFWTYIGVSDRQFLEPHHDFL